MQRGEDSEPPAKVADGSVWFGDEGKEGKSHVDAQIFLTNTVFYDCITVRITYGIPSREHGTTQCSCQPGDQTIHVNRGFGSDNAGSTGGEHWVNS